MSLRTALVIVPRDVPDELAKLHDEWHADAVARGLPLHVTLLFPWIPLDELGARHLERAAHVFAAAAPFTFRLARLDEFPGVLWAAPEPDEAIRRLIAGLVNAFPECPPYEGAFTDPTPHATLAIVEESGQEAAAARLRAALEPLLPVPVHVTEVALLEEVEPERWRERRSLPLGPPTSWPGVRHTGP